MLNPGDRVGDWILDRILGQGGMGSVYLAHNVLTERIRAAVKVIVPLTFTQERERFVREVEALDALKHDAIVGVKGWGEDAELGILWMAMDLVEGSELGDKMANGPVPLGEAAMWFSVIADGLQYAHERGFRHRDIKPANVLIDDGDIAHLVDFGIAMSDGRTRVTAEGKMPGTPAYMAPEVFEVHGPDPVLMDVYALGQVLYEALTGTMAFPENPELATRQQIVHLIHQKVSAQPLDIGPDFPGPVRELVLAATQPKAENRLRDAATFRDALLPYVPRERLHLLPIRVTLPPTGFTPPPAGRIVPGPTDTFTLTLPKPNHKVGMATWAAAGAGLIGMGLVAGYAVQQWRTPPDVRDAVVLVGGIPADTPVSVWVNERNPEGSDGLEFWFPATAVGPMSVAVAAGAQCDFLQFDGTACPPCCSCVLEEFELEPGWEPDLTPVTLATPQQVDARPVEVILENGLATTPLSAGLAGLGAPTVAANAFSWPAVPLGAHELTVSAGECAPADLGCSTRGDCPKSCASDTYPVGITCDAGPVRIHVDAPRPEDP